MFQDPGPAERCACESCRLVASCIRVRVGDDLRWLCARCQPTLKRRLPDSQSPPAEDGSVAPESSRRESQG
jgi:hypothetical protein